MTKLALSAFTPGLALFHGIRGVFLETGTCAGMTVLKFVVRKTLNLNAIEPRDQFLERRE
ncbi:hypothetical protein CR152_00185 [Massilia violaceinigra]|uniref:Uncharacterized protein n=1 Tax=Massilia violaceinigra TaxID=2045208 RepID=A0A2D2DDU3_9BURK|nr:hypothetical protein CR152_00185 [Massilia violaceinigra]